MGTFRIAVLASGTGTNLQAILDGLHGRDGIEVVCVASNKPGARALERAANAGVETGVFPREDHGDRVERDAAMADWLTAREVELIVLAGYMELLSAEFVRRFPNRIVDAVGQALEHGVSVTGVTVHFVDEGVDSGPIILQRSVNVPYTRDRSQLEREIHEVEHQLLPEAIRLIAAGAARVDDRNRRIIHVEQPEAAGNG